MERYDIAVIGTGPAGLSAAITATIRNKKVLLLGSKELSAKLGKAHEIQNYLGFPSVKGEDLAAAFQNHLNQMGIKITEKRINAVYSMGEYFALQSGEEMLEAFAVILATGVVQGKPLPGEEELLGRGVSYCATCDAPLYRGKTVGVIGYSPREEAEAAFLSEVCSEVLYFPMYREETTLPETVYVKREKVIAVEKRENRKAILTAGNEYTVDGVFILREAVSPGQLVPGLPTAGPHVTVNRSMEAGIPGVFACGDLTGTPYQYIKAAGEGNIAALSAVSYLDQKKLAK
ncbi:MAG: NAD(P)/FAD-dependent oxidoreductase [Oscillospiraceae bacterium]|nr:NAD(P)/FAD-dependent oxidoreductase [Oscillospiraceae bacterium]